MAERCFTSRSGSIPAAVPEFLEETAALSRAGKITRRGLPTGFRALRDGLALAARHREMVVLLFPPMPPPVVQKLLFARHNPRNP
jgi:hypothetical protein